MFLGPDTSLLLHLLEEEVGEERVYTVEVGEGEVVLREEYIAHSWFGGVRRKEERGRVGLEEEGWVGLWVRYRYSPVAGATLQVGVP